MNWCTSNLNTQFDDGETAKYETIVSVSMSRNVVGVVAYDNEYCVLRFAPEFECDSEAKNLITVLNTIERSVILCSEFVARRIPTYLKQIRESGVLVKTLPNRVFAGDLSSIVAMLALPKLRTMEEEQKEHYIKSLFPPSHSHIINALCGLVAYVNKRDEFAALGFMTSMLPVLDVHMLHSENLVFVDFTCLQNLQVTGTRCGTANNALFGENDEELCLSKIFSRCCTKFGRKLLRLWMLSPTYDPEIINKRLDAVEFLTKPSSAYLIETFRKYLKQLGNLPRIFCRMQQSSALPKDWKRLLQSMISLKELVLLCSKFATHLYIVRKLSEESIDHNILTTVRLWMESIIDFELTSKQQRFSANTGLDSQLDEWMQTYRCLPDLLSQLAEDELAKLRGNISACGLMYFPLVGFLLKILKAEVESPGIEMCGLEYAFTDNRMAYYRNETTRELDKRYGDVLYAIIDTETAIMHRLQDRILEHSREILRIYRFAAELDCLCAFALTANFMNGTRPIVIEEEIIRVLNGWHPLQQLVTTSVVRNSFSSGSAKGRLTVVTGPNASGKSIYLKQIGLIVYLTQIGSFVPAEKAAIGPVDAIYTLACTEVNQQSECSAYMQGLNLISVALRHATSRSLVILDEFAYSIDKIEAAALTVSIVENMMQRSPHMIISTHNQELLLVLEGKTNTRFTTMKTEIQHGKIVYLYEAIGGTSRQSNAMDAAMSAGIPKAIIARAQKVGKIYYNSTRASEKPNCVDKDVQRTDELLACFHRLDVEKITPELISLLDRIGELQKGKLNGKDTIHKSVL